MSTSSKRVRLLTGLVAGIGVTFGGLAVADADTVTLKTGELLVKNWSDGPIRRNTGSGMDMSTAVMLGSNKILTCGHGSTATDANPNGKIEAFCGVAQLSATGAPTMTVPMKQMTTYNRNRGFRKGTLAAAPGANWAIMGFASTIDNPNNPQHYVRIIDENANWLTERIKINERPNANHGASQMMFAGMDGADFLFVDPDCNNGDTQDIYIVRVNTAAGTPKVTVDKRLTLFDSNIGRGHCQVTGTLQMACVANVGSNRPNDVGIGVALIDVKAGKITHKALVAKSDRGKKIYANQAHLLVLPNNKLAVMHTLSQGRGTDGGRKVAGAPERAVLLTVDGTTLQPIDHTVADSSIIPFARHFSTFVASTAADGSAVIGAVAGAPTASGPMNSRMIGIDAAGKITVHQTVLPVALNADTQYWTRMGNNNPNNQGRSHVTPLVNVLNPGYQQAAGWMPETKTFTVIPTAHFDPTQLNNPKVRNSAYLNFVPTEVAQGLTVTMDGVVSTDEIKSGPNPRSSDGSGGTDPFGPHSGGGGVSCSVGSVGSNGAGFGAFALVGVALALGSLRRRSS
jgi:MYXO-CTERM domain-containing protein